MVTRQVADDILSLSTPVVRGQHLEDYWRWEGGLGPIFLGKARRDERPLSVFQMTCSLSKYRMGNRSRVAFCFSCNTGKISEVYLAQ